MNDVKATYISMLGGKEEDKKHMPKVNRKLVKAKIPS